MYRLPIAVYVVVDLFGGALHHRVGAGHALARALTRLVHDVKGEIYVVALAAKGYGVVDRRAEIDARRIVEGSVKRAQHKPRLRRVLLVLIICIIGGEHHVAVVRLVIRQFAHLAVELRLDELLHRLAREPSKLLVIHILAPVVIHRCDLVWAVLLLCHNSVVYYCYLIFPNVTILPREPADPHASTEAGADGLPDKHRSSVHCRHHFLAMVPCSQFLSAKLYHSSRMLY